MAHPHFVLLFWPLSVVLALTAGRLTQLRLISAGPRPAWSFAAVVLSSMLFTAYQGVTSGDSKISCAEAIEAGLWVEWCQTVFGFQISAWAFATASNRACRAFAALSSLCFLPLLYPPAYFVHFFPHALLVAALALTLALVSATPRARPKPLLVWGLLAGAAWASSSALVYLHWHWLGWI